MDKKYLPKDVQGYTESTNKPVLFVKNLTKKYPGRKKPAITNISLNVYPGEFHAFIGANGAGKTTTIKCLIGAYANWSGTVLINGIPNNKESAKKNLGYIPENARFPEKFSAFSYLVWMAMLSGKSSADAKRIAEEQLKKTNMWNIRHKSPNTFSSGQKKKILLSQALIHNPEVIVMDEPAANLDPKARSEFFNSLVELKKEGKAILISSHILAEIDKYADSATILDGGKIIFSGKSSDLYNLFNKNEWICDTTNNEVFESILKDEKIEFVKEDSNYLVTFPDLNNFDKIQKILVDKGCAFSLLQHFKPTLQDVYDKLVIRGSVDTMKEEHHYLPAEEIVKK